MTGRVSRRVPWPQTAWWPAFLADDSGNVVVEYILVLAAVVLLAVPLLLALSGSINRLMQKIISLLRQTAQ